MVDKTTLEFLNAGLLHAQDLEQSFDFLTRPGRLTYFQDGRNAHRIAVDYKKVVAPTIQPSAKMSIHLVCNGSWCAVIE